MSSRDLTSLEDAHARAVRAVINAMHLASEDEAMELVDSITLVVLETIKAHLPEGEASCN
jgi:hypothetical protein